MAGEDGFTLASELKTTDNSTPVVKKAGKVMQEYADKVEAANTEVEASFSKAAKSVEKSLAEESAAVEINSDKAAIAIAKLKGKIDDFEIKLEEANARGDHFLSSVFLANMEKAQTEINALERSMSAASRTAKQLATDTVLPDPIVAPASAVTRPLSRKKAPVEVAESVAAEAEAKIVDTQTTVALTGAITAETAAQSTSAATIAAETVEIELNTAARQKALDLRLKEIASSLIEDSGFGPRARTSNFNQAVAPGSGIIRPPIGPPRIPGAPSGGGGGFPDDDDEARLARAKDLQQRMQALAEEGEEQRVASDAQMYRDSTAIANKKFAEETAAAAAAQKEEQRLTQLGTASAQESQRLITQYTVTGNKARVDSVEGLKLAEQASNIAVAAEAANTSNIITKTYAANAFGLRRLADAAAGTWAGNLIIGGKVVQSFQAIRKAEEGVTDEAKALASVYGQFQTVVSNIAKVGFNPADEAARINKLYNVVPGVTRPATADAEAYAAQIAAIQTPRGAAGSALANLGIDAKAAAADAKPAFADLISQYQALATEEEKVAMLAPIFGGSTAKVKQSLDSAIASVTKETAVLTEEEAAAAAAARTTTILGATTAITAAAIIAAGLAMAGAAIIAEKYDTKLFDLNAKTGLTVENLAALELASKVSGVSMDSLVSSFDQYLRKTEDAAAGVKSASDTFEKFGFTQKELAAAAKDPNVALEQLLEKLAAAPNKVAQMQMAMELGGRGAAVFAQIIQESGGDLDSMRKKAEELGLEISGPQAQAAKDAGVAWTLFKESIHGTVIEIGNFALPRINEMIAKLHDLTSGAGETRGNVLAGLFMGGPLGAIAMLGGSESSKGPTKSAAPIDPADMAQILRATKTIDDLQKQLDDATQKADGFGKKVKTVAQQDLQNFVSGLADTHQALAVHVADLTLAAQETEVYADAMGLARKSSDQLFNLLGGSTKLAAQQDDLLKSARERGVAEVDAYKLLTDAQAMSTKGSEDLKKKLDDVNLSLDDQQKKVTALQGATQKGGNNVFLNQPNTTATTLAQLAQKRQDLSMTDLTARRKAREEASKAADEQSVQENILQKMQHDREVTAAALALAQASEVDRAKEALEVNRALHSEQQKRLQDQIDAQKQLDRLILDAQARTADLKNGPDNRSELDKFLGGGQGEDFLKRLLPPMVDTTRPVASALQPGSAPSALAAITAQDREAFNKLMSTAGQLATDQLAKELHSLADQGNKLAEDYLLHQPSIRPRHRKSNAPRVASDYIPEGAPGEIKIVKENEGGGGGAQAAAVQSVTTSVTSLDTALKSTLTTTEDYNEAVKLLHAIGAQGSAALDDMADKYGITSQKAKDAVEKVELYIDALRREREAATSNLIDKKIEEINVETDRLTDKTHGVTDAISALNSWLANQGKAAAEARDSLKGLQEQNAELQKTASSSSSAAAELAENIKRLDAAKEASEKIDALTESLKRHQTAEADVNLEKISKSLEEDNKKFIADLESLNAKPNVISKVAGSILQRVPRNNDVLGQELTNMEKQPELRLKPGALDPIDKLLDQMGSKAPDDLEKARSAFESLFAEIDEKSPALMDLPNLWDRSNKATALSIKQTDALFNAARVSQQQQLNTMVADLKKFGNDAVTEEASIASTRLSIMQVTNVNRDAQYEAEYQIQIKAEGNRHRLALQAIENEKNDIARQISDKKIADAILNGMTADDLQKNFGITLSQYDLVTGLHKKIENENQQHNLNMELQDKEYLIKKQENTKAIADELAQITTGLLDNVGKGTKNFIDGLLQSLDSMLKQVISQTMTVLFENLLNPGSAKEPAAGIAGTIAKKILGIFGIGFGNPNTPGIFGPGAGAVGGAAAGTAKDAAQAAALTANTSQEVSNTVAMEINSATIETLTGAVEGLIFSVNELSASMSMGGGGGGGLGGFLGGLGGSFGGGAGDAGGGLLSDFADMITGSGGAEIVPFMASGGFRAASSTNGLFVAGEHGIELGRATSAGVQLYNNSDTKSMLSDLANNGNSKESTVNLTVNFNDRATPTTPKSRTQVARQLQSTIDRHNQRGG